MDDRKSLCEIVVCGRNHGRIVLESERLRDQGSVKTGVCANLGLLTSASILSGGGGACQGDGPGHATDTVA